MSRRLTWLFLAAYAAWYLWLALGASLPAIVNGLLDDSFYYLQVARNVAHGLGSTFDLSEPTNGYHPLWMLCLVPCQWITGGAPEATLRVALLLSGLLGMIALFQVRTLLARERGEWAAGVGILVFAWPRFFGLTVSLLESGLLLLLLLVLIRQMLRPEPGPEPEAEPAGDRPPGARRSIAIGLLLGAACLARLDTIFLVMAWGALGLWRRAWRSVLLGGLACAAVVTPYLLWNLATFGHLQPVSGAVKSTFPHPKLHLAYLLEFKEFTALTLLGGLFFLASLRPSASRWVRVMGWLGLGGLFHLAWTLLFMNWGVDRWHFVHVVPLALLGVPWLLDRALSRWIDPLGAVDATGDRPFSRTTAVRPAGRVLRGGVLLLGLLAAIAVQAYSISRRGDRHLDAAREIAEWARDHLPENAVFAMSDAGVFAWFSGRQVVNLDGLINNFRYQEALRAGRLEEYLRERRVGYLFDQYAYGRPDLIEGCYVERRMRIWYYPEWRVAGEIVLRREDEVVRRRIRSSPAALAPAEENALILWRYP